MGLSSLQSQLRFGIFLVPRPSTAYSFKVAAICHIKSSLYVSQLEGTIHRLSECKLSFSSMFNESEISSIRSSEFERVVLWVVILLHGCDYESCTRFELLGQDLT